jgi:YfiH family protein
MGFYFDESGNLRLQEFERWPWLIHGFSTRSAGNLGASAGNPITQMRENQQRFLATLGGKGLDLVTVRQIHSAVVHMAETGAGRPGDALMLRQPGVTVGVKTADCFPVLVVDPRQRAAAAIHAGWRGAAQRIVEKTVGEMRRAFHSEPADLLAAIGPGIQACCFEVGPDVLEEFQSQFAEAHEFCYEEAPNPALDMLPRQTMTGKAHALMRRLDSQRGHVDLAEAARRQLLAAGVLRGHIYDSGLCTMCDRERFYSHRREREQAGRMMAVIGIKRSKS